jgi:uncharacterized membrane protein YhaH (DUF805 family)
MLRHTVVVMVAKRLRDADKDELRRLVRILALSFVLTVVGGLALYLWLVPPLGHR